MLVEGAYVTVKLPPVMFVISRLPLAPETVSPVLTGVGVGETVGDGVEAA